LVLFSFDLKIVEDQTLIYASFDPTDTGAKVTTNAFPVIDVEESFTVYSAVMARCELSSQTIFPVR